MGLRGYGNFVIVQHNANFLSVNQAVNCYDRPTRGTPATITRNQFAWRKLAPFFGQLFAAGGDPLATAPALRPRA